MDGKKLKIGIIGLGCIGRGVMELIKENREDILKNSGVDLELAKVCDLQKVDTMGFEYTNDFNEILNDEEIDVVIELIGGTGLAKTIVEGALKKKKNVVTANKALLAKFGKELVPLAKDNGVEINYEASVGGGIPIIEALKNSLVSNKINSIYGIVNGTCNYILTQMRDNKLPFDVALKEAQKKGFAEADPALDINGGDSAHKAIVLGFTSFGIFEELDNIIVEGIEDVSALDMIMANDLGYEIKLLAVLKKEGNEVDIRVHPVMISKEHLLSKVDNELNAIFVEGNFVGPTLFYGKGAGSHPTASAVVSDLVKIINQPGYCGVTEGNLTLKDSGEIETRYYLNMILKDVPGVLAKISKVLGDRNISLMAVSQKEKDKEYVPVIFLTHNAKEKDINAAISDIESLDCVKERPRKIRIVD